MGFIRRYRYELALLLTLVVAVFFRFHKLGAKSLWYDELFTVNQASPYISWKQLFLYLQADQHPPLYFILQRLVFHIFGYTEWAARFLPAFFGVLCVWAMYGFGKEFRDKKLGLILALMTAAAQYNVLYSQEARPYTLTWLLAIQSYLFFMRMLRSLEKKDLALCLFFSAALIYTNYFGFLVLASQAVMGLIIWFKEREQKKKVFIFLSVFAFGLLISYLPWIGYMLAQTGLKPYWIVDERPWFFFYYYYAFFGGERLLIPFLVIGPAIYTVHLFRDKVFPFQPRRNMAHLSALFITVSILLPFLVLYMRSELYGPIFQLRYTIVTIPAMYLLVGYGLALVKPREIVVPLGVLFLVGAAYNLVYRHQYYAYPYEKQNRQASAYMAKEGRAYPVVNKVSGWQMKYYATKYGLTGQLIMTEKNAAVDSILLKATGFNIDTFWVVTSFLDVPLSEETQQRLGRSFTNLKHAEFKNITVDLYGRKLEPLYENGP